MTCHLRPMLYVGFRLACRLPHCRFDGDFCTTAQAPLATEGWPSGKQRHANRSITLPLCPPRQIADSWIQFNSGAMPLGDKAKATWPLRAATLKQQAMIMRRSGNGKLVWNQHYTLNLLPPFELQPGSSLSYNQDKTSTFINDFHAIFKWKPPTTEHLFNCSMSMWTWYSYLE